MKFKLLLIPLLFSCIIKMSLAASITPSSTTTEAGSRANKSSLKGSWTAFGSVNSNTSSKGLLYRNTAPVLTTSAGNTTYTVGGAAVDATLTITDAEDATLANATVSITGSFFVGDMLLFYPSSTKYGNITSAYNNATGVLTLSSAGSTATIAQWQLALRSIRLSASSSGNTRTVSFTASDGLLNSTVANKTITIPALMTSSGSTPYMAGGVVVDDMVSITNANSTSITSATVSFSSIFTNGDVLAFISGAAYGNIAASYDNGTNVLTLSSAGNTATVAQWQAALRSVKFIAATNGAVRTTVFTINGATTATKLVKSKLDFITVWDMSKGSTLSTSNKINFRAAGFGIGRRINYTWTTVPASSFSGSGQLPSINTLTTTSITSAFPENMIVQVSIEPENLRGFSMWDTGAPGSYDKDRLIDIKAWGAAPWQFIYGLAYQATNLNVTAKDVPNLALAANLQYLFIGCTSFTGKDCDMSAWNTSAVTNMSNAFTDAVLFNHNLTSWNVSNVTNMGAMFSGARSFNQNLGSWQLNADVSLTNVFTNAGLDCTNYSSTLVGWSQGSVENRILDASGIKYGINSAAARNILTTPVLDGGKGWTITGDIASNFNCPNSPPVLTTSLGNTSYPFTGTVVIDNALTLTDADHITLASAKVSIANNYAAGDVLAFTAGAAYGNITAAYNNTTGVLTLSSAGATATLAEWEAALRSVTFQTTNLTNDRTISFTASDGDAYGTPTTKKISIQSKFVTTWDLSKAGSGANQISFTSSITGGGANYTWTTVPAGTNGSGTIPDGTNGVFNITGLPAGATIELSIEPSNLKTFAIANGSDKLRLTNVKAWGSANWTSMADAFYGASNLLITATDVPNLTNASSMNNMFRDCTILNGPTNIGIWNITNVTTMNSMFYNAIAFNQNIENWNTANVTIMSSMFRGTEAFNQNISNWNIAAVTEMGFMFNGATKFNMNLGSWSLNSNVNLISMLNNSGISCNNYSKTLIAWSNLSVTGRNLGALGLTYGTNANAAYTTLTTPIGSGGKGWTIADAGTSGTNCDNATPVVITSAGNTTSSSMSAVAIDNALTLTDTDNTTLPSATVKIANNYVTGDALAFNPGAAYGNINGNYNNATGILTLTSAGATATLAQWEAALRSITFSTTNHTNTRSISFEVYDGNSYSAIANKMMAMPAFVTTWDLTKGSIGSSQIRFNATVTGGGASYTWNTVPASAINGTGTISAGSDVAVNIANLPTNSIIELSIEPANFKAITIASSPDKLPLINVNSWGSGTWTSMNRAFQGAKNLNITATDVPDLTAVTSMASMFTDCTSLASPNNIGSWNTDNVDDMYGMFQGATAFNQDIGNWNTSGVTNMANMFNGASVFNQNISNWNTTKVTYMFGMFSGAIAFNQNIGGWNTAAVNNMASMFLGAKAFNQNIGNWTTTTVTNMANMFNGATVFNQDISNWNTTQVTNMAGMFNGATIFNQNISNWNTANVATMGGMFQSATAFNQNIGNWNTDKVTSIASMFNGATAFNQSIGNWNTGSVNNMANVFNGATAFNQDIGNWNTALVTNMAAMFQSATAFNQNIGNWNTALVTNMSSMFNGATAFNKNLGTLPLAATVNLSNMLNNSGMSCNNYSKTLIAWSNLSVTGRSLGATGLKYGTNAVAARTTLTTAIGSGGKGWTITDAGSSGANCNNVASPIVTTGTGSTPYITAADVIIDNTVTATDADNTTLASAKVSITNNFEPGDVLTFTSGATYGNITAVYNSATGILTLSSADATATLAEWEAALRSVTFKAVIGTNTKTVSFEAYDGDAYSNIATKTLEPESVLSVDLLSFTATAQANRALLKWSTAAELNNNYFEIERTTDGVNFTSIAKVAGKGTTNQTNSYSAYDMAPLNGVNYYRLKQVDLDGKATKLEIRELRFTLDRELKITLYPNPVSETINLAFSGYEDVNTKIVITNILGQVVHQENLKVSAFQSDYKLNLTKPLAQGHYILRINGKGLNQAIKFVTK